MARREGRWLIPTDRQEIRRGYTRELASPLPGDVVLLLTKYLSSRGIANDAIR